MMRNCEVRDSITYLTCFDRTRHARMMFVPVLLWIGPTPLDIPDGGLYSFGDFQLVQNIATIPTRIVI
jgi:hypothetical protein